MKLEKLNLKFLIRAHTIIGLICIFLFYIATYFGAITLFIPYIQNWELPSAHIKYNSQFNIDEKLKEIIKDNSFSDKHIEIKLPTLKDSRLAINQKNHKTIYLDPNTNEILNCKDEKNTISEFFNEIHYGANIIFIGRPLMGVASLCIVFIIITGVMLFIFNKKKNNQKKVTQRKFWVNWHKYMSIVIIPYVFVFSLTGAFLGLMLYVSSIFTLPNTNYKDDNLRKVVAPIIFKQKALLENSTPSLNLNLSDLYSIAKANYPNLTIKQIDIYNYNNKNSQTVFSGFLNDNRAITAVANSMSITLDSNLGDVLEKKTLQDSHIINKTLSLFYFLHFIPDENFFVRFIFFIFAMMLLFSLISGFMIWVNKVTSKEDYGYYNLFARFSYGIFIGVVPASCLVLFLHYLLPFDLYDRDIWIKGLFYCIWSFCCFYLIYEEKITNAISHILYLSSFLLTFAVIFRGNRTQIYTFEAFNQGLYNIFFVDLAFYIFALVFIFIAYKLPTFKLKKD